MVPSSALQVAYDDPAKSLVEKKLTDDPQASPARTRFWSKKAAWISAVVILLAVIAIAVGVGVGVKNAHSGASSESAATRSYQTQRSAVTLLNHIIALNLTIPSLVILNHLLNHWRLLRHPFLLTVFQTVLPWPR